MTTIERNIRPPTQERSRRAQERILRAALRLLEDRPYQEISVADIARQAGVAVGTVYTRFPSKDQLLLFLFETVVLTDLDESLATVMAPRRRKTESLYDLVRRYFNAIRRVFIKHRKVLQPLSLASRQSTEPALQGFLGTLNQSTHEKLIANIVDRTAGPRRAEAGQAAGIALLWSAAALREKFLYDDPVSSLGAVSDARFVAELARGVVAYFEVVEIG